MTLRIAGLCALALTLAACSGSEPDTSSYPSPPPSTTTSAAEPQTEAAARALAEEHVARYASGDWGGAWDLQDDTTHAAVTREDFIRYHQACKPSSLPLKVEAVRLDGTERAVVRVDGMGFKFTYTVAYADGRWRWKTDPKDLARYDRGVDAMIREDRKDGSCQPD